MTDKNMNQSNVSSERTGVNQNGSKSESNMNGKDDMQKQGSQK